MQYTARLWITGVRKSQGSFDGRIYSNTEVFVLNDMDASKGDAIGACTTKYRVGDVNEYLQFPAKKEDYPLEAELTFQVSASAKESKITCIAYKLIPPVKTKA